jgi:hypothetical protein
MYIMANRVCPYCFSRFRLVNKDTVICDCSVIFPNVWKSEQELFFKELEYILDFDLIEGNAYEYYIKIIRETKCIVC